MSNSNDMGTPAEKLLRQSKSSISTLNRLLAEAEKGGSVPYLELQLQLEEARGILVNLSQGKIEITPATGSIATSNMWQASNIHARAAGQQIVTDLQKRTAHQLLAELNLIETSLQRCKRKAQQRNTYLSEVEQLIGNMRNNGGHEDLSSLHHLDNERTSLQYTRTRVRAILDESNSVMKALLDQGGRLEGTESKVADVLESLGVANSTILQVIRRNKVDAWIVYGGIALTILFIYCIW